MHLAKKMLLEGVKSSEICRQTGITLSSLSYHRKCLGLQVISSGNRYDWVKVQSNINAGLGVRAICRLHGMHSCSYYKAVERGSITLPKKRRDLGLDEFLVGAQGRKLNSGEKLFIKSQMVCEGLAKPGCNSCGTIEWMGQKLTLQLEHKDGNPRNNVLSNFDILCPNCHSLTPTWGNKKRAKLDT